MKLGVAEHVDVCCADGARVAWLKWNDRRKPGPDRVRPERSGKGGSCANLRKV